MFTLLNRVCPLLLLIACASPTFGQDSELRHEPGYNGIWFTLGQFGEYGDKYSGGLGTYTAKHRPIALYSEKADKTFFTYGGSKDCERYLLIMVGAYDHATGKVSRPLVVHDKNGVDDPHDNASIAMDDDGHLWIFVSGRGRSRPGFIYKSRNPHSIEGFEQVREAELTYPQPWWIAGKGFMHCFTKYTKGRELYWSTSPDGIIWSNDTRLAGMGGHYQASALRDDGMVATAFNMHPGGTVDKRTNLYYVQTNNMGKTWTTVTGETIKPPITDKAHKSLIRDFQAEGRLVYMKDLDFDEAGNPVILIVTSSHHMPGPQGDPRTWMIVRWDGTQWIYHEVTNSTHNYDMGQLWLESDELWRIYGPTEPGPQPWGAGGEVALWESTDKGATWSKVKQLTCKSPLNHSYVRRPTNAHPDFFAFWADGNTYTKSPSRLYFSNRAGDAVFQLPTEMNEDWETPVPMTWPCN